VALRGRSERGRGELFAGFRDVEQIGTGGRGAVYRARADERLVALKVLDVPDLSARALEPFEREAASLGAVSSHPNIVTLFRTFRAGDGRPVLELEL